MDIEKALLKGNKRACARLITMLENEEEEGIEIIKRMYRHTGNAYVVGITGPPGSGKSTLTDRLAKKLVKEGKKVGIIAVDPTSPFTGGAILGDRVRMTDLSTDKNVFIRSMGTRGSLGGLSKAAQAAIKVLDIGGADYIFVETVGVGQSEIDIVKTSDTVLMVMVPNLGDDIQAIKAGIMEIADLFAINKSDLDGASKTATEIQMTLDLDDSNSYRPEVVKVSARNNKNISKLLEAVRAHKNYLIESKKLQKRRSKNITEEIIQLVEIELKEKIITQAKKSNLLNKLSREAGLRKIDPYTAKDKMIGLIKED